MKITFLSLLLMFALAISTWATAAEAKDMENKSGEKKSTLTRKQQSIIAIAAFAAAGDIDHLKPALHQGLEAGLTVNEIKEVLVQLYAYAGFPRSLNGLGAFMEVMNERKEKGIEDEVGKAASPMPTDKSSLEFGTENQTKLVGQPVKGPLFDFAPAIDEYLKAHLFGDIFQRDVLTWQERELATIAALANIPGVNSQLQAHYGISPEQLQDFVAVLKIQCDLEVADNAGEVLGQVLTTAGK